MTDNLGCDRFITSNSGGALPPDRFGNSSSRRALLLFHLHTWKREAVDRSKMVTNIFVGELSKITLPKIHGLVERRRKFLIDSPAKFRLLGSKIPLLEVTNRSRP